MTQTPPIWSEVEAIIDSLMGAVSRCSMHTTHDAAARLRVEMSRALAIHLSQPAASIPASRGAETEGWEAHAKRVITGDAVPWPGLKFCETAARNARELSMWVKGEDDKLVASDAALAIETLIKALTASPASPASPAPHPVEEQEPFQDRVAAAHVALFHDDPTDLAERRDRFGEEANEAQQALGQTREGAHQLVDYTYDRPAGDPAKEIGAAALTLASLCVIGGWDMMACAEADLAALVTPEKIAKVRAKRSTRHGRGPLPGVSP